MKAILGLLLTVVLVLLGAVVIEAPLTDSATDPASETFTGAVAANATTATVTLADPHWYSQPTTGNPQQFTVTRSGGYGDITSKCTLGSDRKTVSCTGLTANAADTDLTVSYITAIPDSTVVIVLRIIPFLLIIAGIASAIGTVTVSAVSLATGRGVTSNILQGVIVVFIGAVLVPVVLSFVNLANDAYSVAPEFIGVTAVLSLVTIAYVLALLSAGLGVFAPQVRSALGRAA